MSLKVFIDKCFDLGFKLSYWVWYLTDYFFIRLWVRYFYFTVVEK